MNKRKTLLFAVALGLLSAGPASATSVGFECVSDSNKCATGEAQLSLTVSSPVAGRVAFLLGNEGGEELSAAQLFFDDNAGVLAALLSVVDSPGVNFEPGGKPDKLKGGNKIDFEADAFASAVKPAKDNGVDPGEGVVVTFALAPGKTLQDVLDALGSGDLRVGTNAKKGFVTVPEPAALSLLALGVILLGLRRRS